MTTRVPLLFGTATFGRSLTSEFVKVTDLQECQKILDVFFRHGHTELDAARTYGGGTTEEVLGKLDIRRASIDTKIWPVKPGGHSPATLSSTLEYSLSQLSPHEVRVYYLHGPDRSTPFEETLAEMDRLHKKGLFQQFGLSNFSAWEVAEVVGICRKNSWVQPTVYQSMYNAITRAIEPELVPCIRKLGMRLVTYNPLGGGFFTGRYTSLQHNENRNRSRYIKQAYIDALRVIEVVAAKHNISLTEIALRWLQYHSILRPEDGIIFGASSEQQLEQNCFDSEKGPLPEDVVTALNEAWWKVGLDCPPYFWKF